MKRKSFSKYIHKYKQIYDTKDDILHAQHVVPIRLQYTFLIFDKSYFRCVKEPRLIEKRLQGLEVHCRRLYLAENT